MRIREITPDSSEIPHYRVFAGSTRAVMRHYEGPGPLLSLVLPRAPITTEVMQWRTDAGDADRLHPLDQIYHPAADPDLFSGHKRTVLSCSLLSPGAIIPKLGDIEAAISISRTASPGISTFRGLPLNMVVLGHGIRDTAPEAPKEAEAERKAQLAASYGALQSMLAHAALSDFQRANFFVPRKVLDSHDTVKSFWEDVVGGAALSASSRIRETVHGQRGISVEIGALGAWLAQHEFPRR